MKWLADECFDNDIVGGLLLPFAHFRCNSSTGEIAGHDDVTLLAWAIRNGRTVLSHDLASMVPAILRMSEFGHAPVVLVPDSLPVSVVVEDILLLDECSVERDWSAGVLYLPLR